MNELILLNCMMCYIVLIINNRDNNDIISFLWVKLFRISYEIL